MTKLVDDVESLPETLISITPHNTNNLPYAVRSLYIGGSGNVAVETSRGSQVTFTNVASGQFLGPFVIVKVLSTGTTATGIIGFV